MQRSWPGLARTRLGKHVHAWPPVNHTSLHQLSISILHCHHSSKNKSADSEASLIHLGSGCSASLSTCQAPTLFICHMLASSKETHIKGHTAHRYFYRKPPPCFPFTFMPARAGYDLCVLFLKLPLKFLPPKRKKACSIRKVKTQIIKACMP